MKSFEKVTESIFEKCDNYIRQKNKRKRKIIKTLTPVVCCCLIAALGIGVFQQAVPDTPPNSTETTAGCELDPDDPDSLLEYILQNETIYWSDKTEIIDGIEIGEQDGYVYYTPSVYEAVQKASDDDYIAVYIRIFTNEGWGAYYIPINLEDFKNENPYLADNQALIDLIEKYNEEFYKSEEIINTLINEKGYSGFDAYDSTAYIDQLKEVSRYKKAIEDYVEEYTSNFYKDTDYMWYLGHWLPKGRVMRSQWRKFYASFKRTGEANTNIINRMQKMGFVLYKNLWDAPDREKMDGNIYLCKTKDLLRIINKEGGVAEYIYYNIGLASMSGEYEYAPHKKYH